MRARKSASHAYILPSPATIFWSSRAVFIGMRLPLSFLLSEAILKSSDNGSEPRCLNIGWLESCSRGTKSMKPNLRGSQKRMVVSSSVINSIWSCRPAGGAASGYRIILPDMPRWMINTIFMFNLIKMYFARRLTERTLAPLSVSAKPAGKENRRSRRRWITTLSLRPSIIGRKPAQTVSTSGNSGIVSSSSKRGGGALSFDYVRRYQRR